MRRAGRIFRAPHGSEFPGGHGLPPAPHAPARLKNTVRVGTLGAMPVQRNPPESPMKAGGFLRQYFMLKELGQGKMCEVHLAFDVITMDLVAIKRLHAHHEKVQTFRKRLQREAEILMPIRHPHLVGALANHAEETPCFVVMEYMRGQPLDHRLRSEGGSLFPAEAFRYFGELASGLHFAHSKGIVHRDLRPENVMIDHSGTARLFDFGIAHADDNLVKTQIGDVALMGEYAPPEQMMGKPLTSVSDIYSLGAVIYQCLTAKKVIQAKTVEQLMAQLYEPAKAPSSINPEVPAILDPLVLKCLAKEAAERYQSVKELLIDLGKLYGVEDEADRKALFGKAEDAQLAWARRAFDEKDYEKVIKMAEGAEGYPGPKRAALLRLAALGARAQKRIDQALRFFERAAMAVPNDVNYMLDFGLELVRKGDTVRARKAFERDFPSKADKAVAAGLAALMSEWNSPEIERIRSEAEAAAAPESSGIFGRIASLFGSGGKKG